MEVRPTRLEGVLVIGPVVHSDPRGALLETYHRDRYREAGIVLDFVQDNHSISAHRTLRGLHTQCERPQGKLVRVVVGEIFDVAVDIRRGSPTYLHWVGERLSAENFRQLWIPPGFAHGFCTLSTDGAKVEYKCTESYVPEDEISIAWNDSEIGIDWPVEEPLLSERDRSAPVAAALSHRFPSYSPTSAKVDAGARS